MRALIIIIGFALSGCGANTSPAPIKAAETSVRREFGPNVVIANAVTGVWRGAPVVCGYVSSTGVAQSPTAAFIWTGKSFDVSRWYDRNFAQFDRRAREACGPDWVQPGRPLAIS